jgi:hypothetical protein
MRKIGSEKEIPEPTFYDSKGGGEFYDMSYHGILVHRNFANQTTKVKVLKVKFQNLGINQAECYFKWNINSGRYTPIHSDPDQFEIDMPVNWDNSCWVVKNEKETTFFNEPIEHNLYFDEEINEKAF